MTRETEPPDDSSLSDSSLSMWSRAMRRLGPRWFALALFALALIVGLVAGAIWLKAHPIQRATIATDPAIAADPTHRPLPAPMSSGLSTLPAQTEPAPGTARIETTPAASAPDSNDATSSSTAATPGSDEAASSGPADSTASAVDAPTSNEDRDPQVIERHQPEYPSDALQAHEEGEVRLQVTLDAIGNVDEVRIAHGSGSHSLDRAAIDAVRTWRYRPARRAGQSVSATVEVSVDFNINEH
jgi:protein TonB